MSAASKPIPIALPASSRTFVCASFKVSSRDIEVVNLPCFASRQRFGRIVTRRNPAHCLCGDGVR